MKRKILFSLALFMLIGGVAGCGKTEEAKENTDGKITITCTSEKDNSTGIETQNVSTYHFNKEQYVTDYSVDTTQKFEDKDLYNEYKTAQEETVKDTSDENVSYNLKSDDDTMTLVFTMTVKNINVDDAESEEEKENYKAKNLLSSVESSGYTCTVEGIDRSELK